MNSLEVYCELRSTRVNVGRLARTKNGYDFTYSISWLEFAGSFEIGPDLPLSRATLNFKKIPQSFASRIPPRTSSNYVRYCEERGISPNENNDFVLLTTIGHKGPSSFVFEEDFASTDREITRIRLSSLRENFSVRAIATLFNISKGSLQKILDDQISGPSFQLIEICLIERPSFQHKLRRAHGLSDETRSNMKKWGETYIHPTESGKYSNF